uniref:Uncharacterized protein n=1 Tax=Thermofilum pendens TaxID=2269 RepID=A0A7J3X6X6_THEPE
MLMELAGELEGIVLPYPKELERVLNLYARGVVGYQRLVEAIRESMQGFSSSWLWVEEPLLLALPRLGVRRVLCYLRSAAEVFSSAAELVSLAFRARVTGRIDLEEWRKALGSISVEVKEGYVTVASRAPRGLHAQDTWGLPYPPAETLDPASLSEEAVREYVEYVFNYITRSRNLDEAYLRWLEEKKGLKVPELWDLLRLIAR